MKNKITAQHTLVNPEEFGTEDGWVIANSTEVYIALVELVAQAIAKSYGGDHYGPICVRASVAALSAIGITKPARPQPRAKGAKI